MAVVMSMIGPANGLAFSINLDSATGNYIISYLSEELGREVQVAFEPPTKVRPLATPQVSSSENKFIYSYSLRNLSSARQELVVFRLPTASAPAIVQSPSGWTPLGPTPESPVISWTARVTGVNPGSQQSGFLIQSSDLPGIVALRMKGLTDPLGFPDEPPEDVDRAVLELQREDRNSFVTLFSVGPSTFVFNGPGAAIDRLITLKHQAASLGWLGNAKFVLKLDKRIDQAKAALAHDRKKLARVRLSQFVHDLTEAHEEREQEHGDRDGDHHGKGKGDHRRKKFVNDEAFQLLAINAEFIIAKLPTKAKDKDEEDECRRAEGEKDDDHDDGGKKKDKGRDGGKEHDR